MTMRESWAYWIFRGGITVIVFGFIMGFFTLPEGVEHFLIDRGGATRVGARILEMDIETARRFPDKYMVTYLYQAGDTQYTGKYNVTDVMYGNLSVGGVMDIEYSRSNPDRSRVADINRDYRLIFALISVFVAIGLAMLLIADAIPASDQ